MMRQRFAYAFRRIGAVLLAAALVFNAAIVHAKTHQSGGETSPASDKFVIEHVSVLAVAMAVPSELKCCAKGDDDRMQSRCAGDPMVSDLFSACFASATLRYGTPPSMPDMRAVESELLLRPPRTSL